MITNSITFSHHNKQDRTFEVDSDGEVLTWQQVEQWMTHTLHNITEFMGENHELTITFVAKRSTDLTK